MAGIRFESIRKVYGKVVASNDVSLEIKDGEFMVLLGPSGCGKTTLLRCLAGLEHVDGGRVFIGDRGRDRPGPARPQDRHGFSKLCGLSPHDASSITSPLVSKCKG